MLKKLLGNVSRALAQLTRPSTPSRASAGLCRNASLAVEPLEPRQMLAVDLAVGETWNTWVRYENLSNGLPQMDSNPDAPLAIYLDFEGGMYWSDYRSSYPDGRGSGFVGAFNFDGDWDDFSNNEDVMLHFYRWFEADDWSVELIMDSDVENTSGEVRGPSTDFGSIYEWATFELGTERDLIRDIWADVATYYSMFNINVTTVSPLDRAGYDPVTNDVFNAPTYWIGIGSKEDSMNINTGAESSSDMDPARSLADLTPSDEEIANQDRTHSIHAVIDEGWGLRKPGLIAHEIAHPIALHHQTYYIDGEYQGKNGRADGEEGVARLMGDYGQNDTFARFWNGQSTGGQDDFQDDIDKILLQFEEEVGLTKTDGYAPDDYQGVLGDISLFGGNATNSTDSSNLGGGGTVTAALETMDDVDTFKFSLTGEQRVTIGVSNIVTQLRAAKIDADDLGISNAESYGPVYISSVAADIYVYNSDNILVGYAEYEGQDNPDDISASVSIDLAAGDYYVMVTSHGDYADLGLYDLKVSTGGSGGNVIDTTPGYDLTINAEHTDYVNQIAFDDEVYLPWFNGLKVDDLQRSEDGGATWTSVGSQSDGYWVDSDIDVGRTYLYRAHLENQSYANPLLVRTAPKAVDDLEVVRYSTSENILLWTDVSGETEYRVFASYDGGGYEKVKTLDANTPGYVHSPKSGSASDYNYRVVPVWTDDAGTIKVDGYESPNAFDNLYVSGVYSYVDGQDQSDTVDLTIEEDQALEVGAEIGLLAEYRTTISEWITFQTDSDADPDGFEIKVTQIDGQNIGGAIAVENGTVLAYNNGSFTFTPDADFNGWASFEYTIENAVGRTDTATASFSIAPVNDAPAAVAPSGSYYVSQSQSLKFSAGMFGIEDIDGDAVKAIEIASVDGIANGALRYNGADVTVGQQVTKAELKAGALVYTPSTSSGSDSFQFKVNDGKAWSSNSAAVDIEIVGTPSAVGDTAVVVSGGSTVIDVLANDVEPSSHELTLTGTVTQPQRGAATLTDDDQFIYTHDGTSTSVELAGTLGSGIAVDKNTSNVSGFLMYSQESVHTRFSGAMVYSGNADHFIGVYYDEANDQWRHSQRDTYGWAAFTPEAGDVLVAAVTFDAGASSVDQDLKGTIGVYGGIVKGYQDGDIEFIANAFGNNSYTDGGEFKVTGASFTPHDYFTYEAENLAGETTTAVVAVGHVDPPVGDAAVVNTGESVIIDVTANDGLATDVVWLSTPSNGAVTDHGDGTVTYTHDGTSAGVDLAGTHDANGGHRVSTNVDNNSGLSSTLSVYLMYSATDTHARFSGIGANASDHIVTVWCDELTEQWWAAGDGSGTEFTPEASDVLIAEVTLDYDQNIVTQVTNLEGVVGVEHGIVKGYAGGDLAFYANRWGNTTSTDAGEIRVEGDGFTPHDYFEYALTQDEPVEVGALNSGVKLHPLANGAGYLMYSETDVHTRFSSVDDGNADHLIIVRYQSSSNQWQYAYLVGFNIWKDFTPTDTDVLLAKLSFSFNSNNGQNNTAVTSDYKGSTGEVGGSTPISYGYAGGNLAFYANMWDGQSNTTGTFYITGDYFTRNSADTALVAVRANTAPTATGGSASLNDQNADADTSHTFTLADFGFSDGDAADTLNSITLQSLPSDGELKLAGARVSASETITAAQIAGGELIFTAKTAGTKNLTYTVSDGYADSAQATFTLNINTTPTASDIRAKVNEGDTHTFALSDFGLSNATDADGDAVTVLTTLPDAGTLVYNNGSGPVTLTAANLISNGDFEVNAGDQAAFADWTIVGGNNNSTWRAEVDRKDITQGQDGSPYFASQSGNGSDSYFYQSFATVAGVTYDLSFYAARPHIDNNHFEMDVDVFDGAADPGLGEGGLLNITLGDSDVGGFNDVGWVRFDYQFTAASSQATLRFRDPGTGSMDPAIDSVSVSGGIPITASDIRDGNLTYTAPDATNSGSNSSFDFQVSDDAAINPVVYTMDLDINALPTADGTAQVLVDADGEHVFTADDFQFADADGDSLSHITITSLPTAGTLETYNTDGDSWDAVTVGMTISHTDLENSDDEGCGCNCAICQSYLRYTPNAGSHTDDSFGFTLNDGRADSVGYTMSLIVNAAPTATDGSVTVNEGDAYTFSAGDIGYSDADGDALASILLTSAPDAAAGEGMLEVTINGGSSWEEITPSAVTAAISGGVGGYAIGDLDPNGDTQLRYTAPLGGTDYAFTFQAADAYGSFSGEQTMTLNVNAAPSIATALDDLTVVRNAPDTVIDVSSLATDADGEVVTYSVVGNTNSSLVSTLVSGTNLTLAYSPDTSGAADITVRATDGNGLYAEQTFSVLVTAPPTAIDGTVRVNAGTPHTLTGDDLGYHDEDGDTLTVLITSTPSEGALTYYDGVNSPTLIDPDATGTYSIAASDIEEGYLTYSTDSDGATDGVTFAVSDGYFTSAEHTLTFAINAAPTAVAGSVAIDEGEAYVFGAGDFNYSDADGDALETIYLTNVPGAGELAIADLSQPIVLYEESFDGSGSAINGASPTYGSSVYSNSEYSTAHWASDNDLKDDGEFNSGVFIATLPFVPKDHGDGVFTLTAEFDVTYQWLGVGFTESGSSIGSSHWIHTDTGAALWALEINESSGNDKTYLGYASGSSTTDGVKGAGNSNKTSMIITVDTSGANGNWDVTWDFDGDGVDRTESVNPDEVDIQAVGFSAGGGANGVIHSFKLEYMPDDPFDQGIEWTTISAQDVQDAIDSGQAGYAIGDLDAAAGNPQLSYIAPVGPSDYTLSYKLADELELTSNESALTLDVVYAGHPFALDSEVLSNSDGTYTFTASDFGFTDAGGDPLDQITIQSLPAFGSLMLDGTAVNATGITLSVDDINNGLLVYSFNLHDENILNSSPLVYYDFESIDTSGSVAGATEDQLGNLGYGLAFDSNETTGSDEWFVMYSAQDVHQRFAGVGLASDNAEHFVVVKSEWTFDEFNPYSQLKLALPDGNGWYAFTPLTSDILVAEVEFDDSTTTVTDLKGATPYNMLNTLVAGYADGDLTFAADQWNGASATARIQIAGTYFDRSSYATDIAIVDASGNGYDAAFFGDAAFPDVAGAAGTGAAYESNPTGGVQSSIVLPDNDPQWMDAVTFEMLINLSDDTPIGSAGYRTVYADGGTRSMIIQFDDDTYNDLKITYNPPNVTWKTQTYSNLDISQNEWFHLAVTFDAVNTGELQVYINGQAVEDTPRFLSKGQQVELFGENSGSGPIGLGTYAYPSGGQVFDYNHLYGGLDEFAVYDRLLSEAEIAAHAGAALLDYQQDQFDFSVTSASGQTSSSAAAMTVKNLIVAPTVSFSNTTFTLNSDADTSTEIHVADIDITDDAYGSNTLSLSGTNANLFSLVEQPDGDYALYLNAGVNLSIYSALEVRVEVDYASISGSPNSYADVVINITSGSALAAAEGDIPGADASELTRPQLNRIRRAAIDAWRALGAHPSAFGGVDLEIADLAGDLLGQYEEGAIYIDVDAAGHGWFVDATPWEDTEFEGAGPEGMDLLTVMTHELGHHLGLEHSDNGIMDDTLEAGTRVRPTAADLGEDNLFVMRAELSGRVFADSDENGRPNRRENGLAGVTVEWLGDQGGIIATAVTNRRGRFSFDEFQETGDDQIRLAVPDGQSAATATNVDVLVSAGEVSPRRGRFGLSDDREGGNDRRGQYDQLVDGVFGRLDLLDSILEPII